MVFRWQDKAKTEADFIRTRDRFQLTSEAADLHRWLRREIDEDAVATSAAAFAPAIIAERLDETLDNRAQPRAGPPPLRRPPAADRRVAGRQLCRVRRAGRRRGRAACRRGIAARRPAGGVPARLHWLHHHPHVQELRPLLAADHPNLGVIAVMHQIQRSSADRRVRARPEPRQRSQSVLGMLIVPCRGVATQSSRRIVI